MAEEVNMIQELTKRFYRRNPSLASDMIGWGVLEYARMLIIALILVTLVSEAPFYAGLVEWCILLFLFDFEKNLKQLVVVSLEPQNLRMVIRKEFKKKEQWELEFAQKKVPICRNIMKVSYWFYIFRSTSLEGTVTLTILCMIFFEYFFLISTEADKLLKK